MTIAMEDLSKETLDELLSKAAQSGWLSSLNVQGIDLSGLVSQVPVVTPARNEIPREIAGMGSLVAQWEALLNVNNQQANPAIGVDYAGPLTKFEKTQVFAPYVPLAQAGRVTQDAIAQARNYADALAVAELQVMNQLLIGQDCHIINSQAYALPAVGIPSTSTSTTTGTIASGTAVYVACAPRSGINYFYGGSGPAVAGHITSGSTTQTNTVTATVAAVQGAVAYDWFVGTAGTQYYYTTTTVASVTVTFVPTAAQALPTLPLLSTTAPTTAPTADTSWSANNYNGIIASSLGDYGVNAVVTPGTGVYPSGATFQDNGASTLTLTGSGIAQLDEVNLALWNSVQLSPTCYMVNAQQGQDISEIVLGTSAATTFLPANDASARNALVGGGFLGFYVNRAAGGSTPIPIVVHPRVAPGTIIARTDRVPFPGSNIGSVFSVRCQYDTARFDYYANYNQIGRAHV